ncbi:hypothetical protein FRB90_003527 [Tulasnella sp. 427]|nr:hypothetical protein FRB90_003527 [Tulasnella sp. 427]
MPCLRSGLQTAQYAVIATKEDLDGDELDLVAYDLRIQGYIHMAQKKLDTNGEDCTTSMGDLLPSPGKASTSSHRQLTPELTGYSQIVLETSSPRKSTKPVKQKKGSKTRSNKTLTALRLKDSPDSEFTAYKRATAQLSPSGKKWYTRKSWTDGEFQLARDALKVSSGGILVSNKELSTWNVFWTHVYAKDSNFARNQLAPLH